MRMNSRILTTLTLLALGATAAAEAHEKAVLKSARESVPAGETIPLTGSKFEKGVKYRLALVGALETVELREIEPDTAGSFAIELQIPREARPGIYRVVAFAPDGDKVASLEILVSEAAVEEQPADVGSEEAGAVAHSDARADDLVLQVSRSSLE